jgi:putative transposase
MEEGHLMSDHVHMILSIPLKYWVAEMARFNEGKSAIAIARRYMDRAKNFVGQNFWARGYYVSTVGKTKARSENRSGSTRKRADGSINSRCLTKRVPA